MKLRQRYAIVLGATSVLIVLIVSIIHFYKQEQMDKQLHELSFNAMTNSLHFENEEAARELTTIITSSLIEPMALQNFEDIGNIAKAAFKLPRISEILIFDGQGILLHDGTDTIDKFGKPVSLKMLKAMYANPIIQLHRDDKFLIVVSPIRIADRVLGGLCIKFKLDEIVTHIDNLNSELTTIIKNNNKEQFRTTVSLVYLLSLLSMIVGYFISRQLSEPILKLTQQAQRIGRGEYKKGITSIIRNDEVGELTDSINWMAQEISEQTVTKVELEKQITIRTKELEQANEKLLRIDKERREFLTDIGHEFRTPLTAIRGVAEVSLRTNNTLDISNKSTLKRIVELSGQLGSLVDDLLFITRSESGMPELNIEPVSLFKVLSKVSDSIKPEADREGISIKLSCDQDCCVNADPRRLVQLFTIFLDNAVKYSYQNGVIHVEINCLDNGKGNTAEVKIADNGIGMNEVEQVQCFKRFFRGNLARETNQKGMGLGLSIAKAIVHAHNAKFNIISESTQGTTVIVSFPQSDIVN